MEVVKKPLNIKEEEARDVTSFDASLYRVDHTQDGVRSCMVVPRPKLSGGEEVESRCVKQDPFSDDLLKEFATALQEGYQPVGLGSMVVRFARLRNRDDSCAFPGMMAPEDCGVEQRSQAGWRGGMAPLKELVCDPGGARGRLVGSRR